MKLPRVVYRQDGRPPLIINYKPNTVSNEPVKLLLPKTSIANKIESDLILAKINLTKSICTAYNELIGQKTSAVIILDDSQDKYNKRVKEIETTYQQQISAALNTYLEILSGLEKAVAQNILELASFNEMLKTYRDDGFKIINEAMDLDLFSDSDDD